MNIMIHVNLTQWFRMTPKQNICMQPLSMIDTSTSNTCLFFREVLDVLSYAGAVTVVLMSTSEIGKL